MLINKGLSSGDIVTVKLINGDEVIARLEEETADTITIDRPLMITMSTQGLGMIPWVFLAAKTTYTLQKNQIFLVVPSKKEAADQYMEGTTGIALA
jgi:hypothetical protein